MCELRILDAIMEVSIALAAVHKRQGRREDDPKTFRLAVRELREAAEELDRLVRGGKTKPPW